MVVKFTKQAKLWISNGDVGFTSWSPEGAAVWIRAEDTDHVIRVILIQQHEGDPPSEWPAE